MYLRTEEYSGFPLHGWGYLSHGIEMKMKVVLDPCTLTPSGRATIRRWLRRGYCERGRGHLVAYWQALMYLLDARYVVTCDPWTARIRFFDPGMRKEFGDGSSHPIHGLLALLKESTRPTDPQAYNPNVALSVDSCEPSDSVKVSDTGRSYVGEGRLIGPMNQVLQLWVTHAGHPLSDMRKAYAYVDTYHEVEIAIDRERDRNRRYGASRTVIRRKL